MKHEKPWVQDLNWSNRCKLESKKYMKKKIMQHTLASDMGTSVPPYGIGLPENTSDKAAKQYVNEREGKVGGNSSRKGTGRKQKTTGRLMTNRSTSRSTARRTGRSSYRGSTGRSSIATIDTFAKATFRTAKYIVQATQGSAYQINEIIVTHDGTTAYGNDYAETRSGSVLSTYTVDISSNDVRLRATNGSATSTVYKIYRTLIAV